jgi:hypothetical protein
MLAGLLESCLAQLLRHGDVWLEAVALLKSAMEQRRAAADAKPTTGAGFSVM